MYEKHPDTAKTGGLNVTETNSSNGSILTDVVKQLGKKMMEGNLKDILKMSRPAKISSPITHLVCFANDFLYTDLLIEAEKQTDPIERIKYITTFILSGLHRNLLICKSKAPLNPILGETFQAYKEDGTQIYLEQTCHHPPTSNYLVKGPDNSFQLFGFAIVVAQLNGMNSIKGWREGKNILKFKDGSMITFTVPETRINGLLMGERSVNYNGNLIIKDFKNKIESVTTFAYKETGNIESLKNSISSLFGSKAEETPYDHMIIQISKLNTQTKVKDLVSEGHGSWLGQIYFDGKKFWSINNETHKPWLQQDVMILQSDSLKRNDLISITNSDYNEAQKSKDDLENLQRSDKKLREKFK